MIEDNLDDLAEHCIKAKTRIVTAESCTGGLVAKLITDRAGSSNWFDRGYVSYSNLAKQEMLGVPEDIILQWGAVSDQVARAMAEGALLHSEADYALAITGIAGPGGGTTMKPVGMVCFGWALKSSGQVASQTRYFSGNREEVRVKSAHFALQEVLELIKKHSP